MTQGNPVYVFILAALCLHLSLSASASSTLTTLVVFNGTNGAKPSSSLLAAKDGNIYGTTFAGGVNDLGTVFKLSPEGRLTVVASFDGFNGKSPCGELVEGTDGSLYGTALEGGKGAAGVVFRMIPEGAITPLIFFSDYNQSGGESLTGIGPCLLVCGDDDCFYGATAKSRFMVGPGTVFRLGSSGTFSRLTVFDPQGEATWLVQVADKYYFTTTSLKLQLQSLKALSNGHIRGLDRLVRASDGSFYGTTREGGRTGNGNLFKFQTNGAQITLVDFDGTSNGRVPNDLIVGGDGNLYGTTFAGDTHGPPVNFADYVRRNAKGEFELIDPKRPFPGLNPDLGTIFSVTPSGRLTTLAVFNRTNGCYPTIGLTEGRKGTFYGTTSEGGTGTNASGTLFKLTITP